ncbi:MAG TPA: succinate dehydrogenase, hydrophobic membrane anchor protein [Phenylobacterium sp.]
MSYRTPLSTARGLGSAKHGVGHWLSERVAAVALIPLSLWAAYSVILLARMDYYEAAAWIGSPLNATLTILSLGISFMHMQSGLRVVIEDYVYSHLNKAACLLANLFVCGLAGALAIMSILKVALGGG